MWNWAGVYVSNYMAPFGPVPIPSNGGVTHLFVTIQPYSKDRLFCYANCRVC